ncbi:MAG: hypothetical protein FWD69_04205 [Polyangiaceae bacterium]|nr:hypothetical protein [Polyangiaceae bacterium]
MNREISILRALLHSARCRTPITIEDLCVCGPREDIVRALAALVRTDLVLRTPAGPRLSLAGFAVAVACDVPDTQKAKAITLPAVPDRCTRILPVVHRRSAA